jgi:large subunit ribosomal protein L7/L12
MPRCPFCDQDNPPGLKDCVQCRATLPRDPEAERTSSHAGEFEDELRRLVAEGNKIEAIRRFRAATGAGLAEAKKAVEALAAGGPPGGWSGGNVLDDELRSLLKRGDKIGAIKLYRGRTGEGLREAKDTVEALARQEGLPVRGAGCLGSLVCVLLTLAAAAVFLAG